MASKDLYGIKTSKGTFMIPQVSKGKLGLISPEKVNEIDTRLDTLTELLTNLIKDEVTYNDLKVIGDKLRELEKMKPSITGEVVIEVDELPELEDAKSGIIYVVSSDNSDETNSYKEYLKVNNQWEVIGQPTTILEEKIMEDKNPIDDNDINNLFE